MTADSIFNAYIDANLVLFLAAVLWAAARFVLNQTWLRRAGLMQLHLIYGILLAVAATPLVIALHHLAAQAGLWGAGYSASISDFALAQFLNGRIGMSPSQFEALWMSRLVFTQDVTGLSSVLGIAVALFLAGGALIGAGRLMRNAWQVGLVIRRGYLWRRFGTVHIVLTDRIDVPFSTRGLTRRYIVLPSALLSQADDLRIAIAHELQHMRQGDLGWEIALEALRPVFFWNPAFIYLKREVDELRELACDQQILARRQFGVRDYCDCLLRVCQNALGHRGLRQVAAPSVPLLRSGGGRRAAEFLKRRVVAMLSHRQPAPSRWVTAALILPFAAAIGFGAISSQGSQADWSQDRLMLSTIVNLERLDQRTLATRY
ncbi:M56 family metallopeptidase [Roseovarius sp. CAU 1744]|uniref:M56 family metallopeptidase n=1 Tax=Roseovarius sp. CAU 1744 TaxID=3140368 RepID=UPI00325C0375